MDMVEKVARALAAASEEPWDAKTFSETLSGNDPDDMRAGYLFLARAAIAAMKEPTAGMLAEADAAMRKRIVEGPSRFRTLRAGYSAMIDAALTSSEG